ncbi:MAG: flagella cluster protein [Halobacteriales archaeon]
MAGFDVHDHRHALKLLKDTGGTELYDNREGVACPACDRAFDTLFVTERDTASFDPDGAFPFCVLRDGERLYVFTH